MRKEDREFKTIFFIWGYHLYVTIPIRSKSSFLFKVIECGKDCNSTELYLKNYLRLNNKYTPHEILIRDNWKVFLTDIKKSNVINWEVFVRRKSLAYQNKWKIIYFKKFFN